MKAERVVPTPQDKPFTILLDSLDSNTLPWRSLVEDGVDVPPGWRIRWDGYDSGVSNWDAALVSPWTAEALGGADLRGRIEKAYPLHRSDFIVSVSDCLREGRLVQLPVALRPDFLYARNRPEWRTSLSPQVFAEALSAGARLAIPEGPVGDRYRTGLSLAEDQAVRYPPGSEVNPYTAGEVDLAIGDRNWLIARGATGDQLYCLADIFPEGGCLDRGIRFLLSEDVSNPDLADQLLAHLVTDLQSVIMTEVPGVFPIRRSVYASPRTQGVLFGAPKNVFDRTLDRLVQF